MQLPSSLLARTNAVLGISAIAITLAAVGALFVFVITPITDRSAGDEAGLIVLAAKTWVELQPDARPYFEIELLEYHDLIVTPDARELPLVSETDAFYGLLEAKLAERLGQPVQLMEGDGLLWANVAVGSFVIQVGFSPQRRELEPMMVAIIVIGAGSAIVFFASLFIVRRVAGPLVAASEAVEAFRGAEGFKPLPEEGPSELVTLAKSFNAMAHDVSTLLSNRTTLLAGISHDLRTPLARMRLALELLPEDVDRKLVDRFERNLIAMDELITDALRFARGAGEAPEEVEVVDYVESVVRGVDERIELQWAKAPGCEIPERALVASGALQRVVENLLGNAVRHGDGARVRVDVADRITIHVLDDGPGIPEEYREQVFQPFYRLEGSRNRMTGGSGLGLAIVQQLCDAHGWEVGIQSTVSGGTDAFVAIGIAQAA